MLSILENMLSKLSAEERVAVDLEMKRLGREALIKGLEEGQGQLDAEQTPVLEACLDRVNRNRGFWPDGKCYRLGRGMAPHYVVELAILHPDGSDRFLLKHREDEDFVGFAFPGGTVQNKKLAEDSCNRHATMDGVCKKVTNLRIIGSHHYQENEHPYQFPVINFVACDPVGEVVETDTCRWFSEAPPDLIKNAPHGKYIEVLLEWFKGGRKQYATFF
jgi:hypothetical protein